jgi:hypothetical protein
MNRFIVHLPGECECSPILAERLRQISSLQAPGTTRNHGIRFNAQATSKIPRKNAEKGAFGRYGKKRRQGDYK